MNRVEGFGNDPLHPYALEAYYWNGAALLRIKRIVAFKADGHPQWFTSVLGVLLLKALIPSHALRSATNHSARSATRNSPSNYRFSADAS